MVIARDSVFVLTELHPIAGTMIAAQSLHTVIQSVPYNLHAVLADKGIQLAKRRSDRYVNGGHAGLNVSAAISFIS